jgi:hypothetical protein
MLASPASERFPSLEIVEYYWYKYVCRWKHQTKKGNKCRIVGKGGEKKIWSVIQCKKQDLTLIPPKTRPVFSNKALKWISIKHYD